MYNSRLHIKTFGYLNKLCVVSTRDGEGGGEQGLGAGEGEGVIKKIPLNSLLDQIRGDIYQICS